MDKNLDYAWVSAIASPTVAEQRLSLTAQGKVRYQLITRPPDSGGRVFDSDIETCRDCGGSMKVIACIEYPVVIKKILTHLRGKGLYQEAAGLPQSGAPPQDGLFS